MNNYCLQLWKCGVSVQHTSVVRGANALNFLSSSFIESPTELLTLKWLEAKAFDISLTFSVSLSRPRLPLTRANKGNENYLNTPFAALHSAFAELKFRFAYEIILQ